MKIIIIFFCIIIIVNIYPQEKVGNTDATFNLFGIDDRAGGTHNAGNMGLFFENYGKLYPRYVPLNPL